MARRGEKQAGRYVEQSVSTAHARHLFISAARDVCPRFFAELKTDVFPQFTEICKTRPDLARPLRWAQISKSDPAGAALRYCVTEWARRFHVPEEPWLLNDALRTLRLWHSDASSLDRLVWAPSATFFWETVSADERKFEFIHAGWDPSSESFTDFTRSLEHEFHRCVGAYESKLRAIIEHRGSVVKTKMSNAQFRWFALYHLLGLSYNKIVKWCADSGEAVNKEQVRAGIQRVYWYTQVHSRV